MILPSEYGYSSAAGRTAGLVHLNHRRIAIGRRLASIPDVHERLPRLSPQLQL